MRNPIARAYNDACLAIYRGTMLEHENEQWLYEVQARAIQAIQRRHNRQLLMRHMSSIRPILRRIKEQAERDA